MANIILKRIIPSAIGLVLVVLAALWLYGFIGVKAGWIGPTEVPGVDVGKLILSPTRTYAPLMIPILKEFRKQIHGIIHCSGGAQTKVLHFVDKLHIVKDNMLQLPPLFRMIQQASGTDWKEMYKVFNMGSRLEIYTNEKAANEMIAIAKEFNIDSQIIGHVEASDKKQLTIKSEFGMFEY